MKELRATIEAERAHEQEVLNAKLAEAEALVSEAKALTLKQAEMQAQSAAVMITEPAQMVSIFSPSRLCEAYAAQTSPVSPAATVQPITLKRKRDELEEEDEASSSSSVLTAANSHRCCATAIASELTGGRPVKRRRSMAMRLVSGVAKTTAIAAVGAVATWSVLAFS